MAAETTDITGSNQPDILSYLEHILTDLHLALERLDKQGRIQAEHHRMFQEFKPLLAQFRSPAAAMITSRRARRASSASQDPA